MARVSSCKPRRDRDQRMRVLPVPGGPARMIPWYGLGTDTQEGIGVLEGQLDQVACGFDGGVLAEDVGVSRGRYGSLRGLLASRSVRRRSASEVKSETDTDTAMATVGAAAEVGWRNLAVGPERRRLAFKVVDQGPSGVIGGQGVG